MLTRRKPRLRFIIDPITGLEEVLTPPAADAVPAAPAVPPVVEPKEPEFPANTAVADMTADQRAAYWRHYSRKHEADLVAARAEITRRDTEGLSASEKREQELRDEGKTAGAEPFIAGTVAAEIRLATGKTKEEVVNLLAFVDVNKFLTNGAIDDAKIAAYATGVGTAAPAAPPIPPRMTPLGLTTSMSRNSPGAPRTGGSIAERKAEIIAERAKK